MSFLYSILPDSFDEHLETEHLLLRPYQEGDEAGFMRLIKENSTALYPAFSGRLAQVRVLEDARTQLAQLRTDWDNRRMFDFGVWVKSDDTYIGDIALKNIERSVPKAEAALYFTDWPETRDYAREALSAVLQFAFEMLLLNKVYIRCTETNAYYGELAEACGFRKEGVLRSDFRGADSEELLDLSYYGLTREDYEQTKQRRAKEISPEAVA